jgi:hypothetical protein
VAVAMDDAKNALLAEADQLPVGSLTRALRGVLDGWLADPSETWRARFLLQGLREGDAQLVRMAFQPYDDEPVTDEERAAIAEAAEDLKAGRTLRWAQARERWLRP